MTTYGELEWLKEAAVANVTVRCEDYESVVVVCKKWEKNCGRFRVAGKEDL